MYYNYIYLDPRKPGNYSFETISFLYEPIYVGKGSSNRCYYHLENNSRIDNPIFRNKLNLLKKSHNMRDFIVIINFTENELDSYISETSLITEIGSNHITSVKDGTLVNVCLENKPPSLKGKTYKEIYGDRYVEEIEKRRKIQLKRGGYFGGKNHTQESKDKISKSMIVENNPMYGKKHSVETIEKISKKAKEKIGSKNSNAKTYIVISPDGIETKIFGEVEKFCLENNLSYSTLRKTLKTGKKVSHGKTKGWILIFN
jgi:hypothetical protein